LFDTISSIRDNEYPGGMPTAIQYASSMELLIQLDNKNPEKIYVPVLKVSYRARPVTTVKNGGSDALATATFVTSYDHNIAQFNSGINKTFWIVFAICMISIVVLTYFQLQRPHLDTGADAVCVSFIIRFIVNSFDLFSKFFFWYLFFATGWVFVFFKLQDHVYMFMPSLSQYEPTYKNYDALFGVVCATKLISLMFKIYFDQCSMQMFLIDWERPKLFVHTFFT